MSVNGTNAPLSSENRPSVMGREYRAFIDSDAKSGTTACGYEFVRVGGMRAALPSSCVPTAQNPVTDKAVLVNRQFVFSSDWEDDGNVRCGRTQPTGTKFQFAFTIVALRAGPAFGCKVAVTVPSEFITYSMMCGFIAGPVRSASLPGVAVP